MSAGQKASSKRVTILGAGPAGLATAWELSGKKDEQGKPLYDITLYDMSWRPGGKCASGRTSTPDQRIVQNGTHYVFGVYRNMFQILGEAYEILNGSASGVSHNHAAWGGMDEFVPRHVMALRDACAKPYENWILPVSCAQPGAHGQDRPLDAFAVLDLLLDLIEGYRVRELEGEPRSIFRKGQFALREAFELPPNDGPGPSSLDVNAVYRRCRELTRELRAVAPMQLQAARPILDELREVLPALRDLLRESVDGVAQSLATNHVASLRAALAGPIHCALRRVKQIVDLGATLAFALIFDGVLLPGSLLDLDKLDVLEWLLKRGMDPSTASSPLALCWYDALAAYANGDPNQPSLSAAAFIQTFIPAVLNSQGCFIYQMVGEVGENLAGPIYQVLKDRGVKFRWMHRVSSLELSANRTHVDRVNFELPVSLQGAGPRTRQALLKYDPVIQFTLANGQKRNAFRECPGAPFEDVLPGGVPANAWYAPPTTPHCTFTIQRDHGAVTTPDGYDVLVFALPHTVIPYVASELSTANAHWATIEKLPAVETRSLRLWIEPDFSSLLWDQNLALVQPVLANFRDNFFVWEDSGQQLEVHTWPAGQPKPRAIATLFAPLPARAAAPHRDEDPTYVVKQRAQAELSALAFIGGEAARLWQGIASGPGLDLSKVILPPGSVGPVKGFVVANSGPIERYVHAAPRTYPLRIDPFDPGFKEFFVAGDWVRLWPATGNIEQAMISGRIAGLLIHGHPKHDLPGLVPNYPGLFPE